ncbi:MAG: hypothetical protein EXR93_02205 [Gemmatimonadetes bacterium]|nr:hypothetical protein [Gemmatimonadota bacterium]
MDKQTLAVMIPVIVMLIPLSAVILNGWQKIIKLRIEEAKARGVAPESSHEIEDIRNEVDLVRRELGEVQERLDFAERLLARNSERDRLQGPAN